VRRRRLEVVPLDGVLAGDREDEWPERSLAAAERRREMADLLTELPERYRIPVVLRYIEDLGYGEIADVLGQPVGTVKANVHRGIGKLRLMVEEEVPV
jgi:RNA polymerase sigma-70 factor (ECF subfamily)